MEFLSFIRSVLEFSKSILYSLPVGCLLYLTFVERSMSVHFFGVIHFL